MKRTFKKWFLDFGDAYLADRTWISILFATPLVYFYGDIFRPGLPWGMPRLLAGIAILLGNFFRALERLWKGMSSLERRDKIYAWIFIPVELAIAALTLYLIFAHYIL